MDKMQQGYGKLEKHICDKNINKVYDIYSKNLFDLLRK